MQHLLSPNQQEIKLEPHSPKRHTPQYPNTPSPNPYVPQQNLAGISCYQPHPEYTYSGDSSGINEILLDLYKPNNPVIQERNIADICADPSPSTAIAHTGTTMPITLPDTNMNQLDQAANTQNPLDNNSSYIMNISSFLNEADQLSTLSTGFLNFFNDPVQGCQQVQQAQQQGQNEQADADEENMSGSFLRMNLQ